MANVLVEESSLQSIAAAIRMKNGTRNTYTPAQMGPAIAAIDDNGGYTKYLYYRLYITNFCRDSNTERPFQNIARFVVVGIGGMDLANLYGASYTASSVVSGSSAANAFDGNPETLWESDWANVTDATGWVQVQMDKPRAAIGFVLYTRINQRDYPLEALIQASNDGTTWTTLVTIDGTVIPQSTWYRGCNKPFILGSY